MAVITETKNNTIADGIGQVGSAVNTKHYGYMIPAASTSGTDTTPADGRTYVTAIMLPANVTITGISYLIGTVGGTDKAIAILFSAAGAVLAYSALAGVTVGTTATMQQLPFTAAYTAPGPGQYFVGIVMNGTTARIRTQIFGDHPAGYFDQTFGAPVAITPPTTFTTARSPIVMTY